MGPPPRILVVDDAEDTRELYAEILRFNGYEVDCASDGDAALRSVAEARPALIMLDLVMPRVSGDEVTRRIKSSPETRDIIVVVLTGQDDRRVVEELRGLGADDVCLKPCLPDELLGKVKMHLGPV